MPFRRMYTNGVRKSGVHDSEFVRRARERRRIINLVAKERRKLDRRNNEEYSFELWVSKMQRKARAAMVQQY